jgi:hypothetical protein
MEGMRRKKTWKCSLAVFAVMSCLTVTAPGAVAADKKKSRVVREAVLFGTVFQESGFLLRGARVVVYNADRPKDRKEAVTDIQGEFAVRVPAGKAIYTVEVSAPGFVTEKKTAEITGDERVDMTFRLAPEKK